ncbi:MAG: circadian clock protein KaiC, partial [Thermoplasmata archaeon]|nr:circadian clock protein KaiC [Thermoplasmata archaeon]
NENSTTVVIGSSGAGKTTFATQFIRRGLEEGQEGIFVSLDENKEQIIREAVEMGWSEVLEYLDDELLVFIDASGREFSNFIKKELPAFVSDWSGSKARIAIDPLTPVMWSSKDLYEQRDLIGFMLKQTRKVGTVLCTLEEHGGTSDLSGAETVIPMYLADCVIHLRYIPLEGGVSRMMKIVKCRSSRHSEHSHPYFIMRGLGLVVEKGEYEQLSSKDIPKDMKIRLAEKKENLPPKVYDRLEKALDELTDGDFRGLKAANLVDNILDEYVGE